MNTIVPNTNTAATFLALGFAITGKLGNTAFKNHFGCSAEICCVAWSTLLRLRLISQDAHKEELLYCLLHMHQPGSVSWAVLSSIVDVPNSAWLETKVSDFLVQLARAEEETVSWADRFRGDAIQGYRIMAAPLEFLVLEPPTDKDSYYDQKTSSYVIRYWMCLSSRGDLVSTGFPMPGGLSSGQAFAATLMLQLDRSEKVLVGNHTLFEFEDDGELKKETIMDHAVPLETQEEETRLVNWKLRLDGTLRRFFEWGSLKDPSTLRTPAGSSTTTLTDMHEQLVRAVAFMTQLEMQEQR